MSEPEPTTPILDQVVENYPIFGLNGEPTVKVGSRTYNKEVFDGRTIYTWRDADGSSRDAFETHRRLSSTHPWEQKDAQKDQIELAVKFAQLKSKLGK